MHQAAAPEEVERQVNIGKALELRIGGANYRQIAKALRISLGTAHGYVTEGLDQLRDSNAETMEQLRRMEVVRLDAMLVSLWSRRDNPRTADTILRICERRARLLGLDVGTVGDGPLPSGASSSMLPSTISIVLVAPDRAAGHPIEAEEVS
jgi:hypothetical protein